MIYRKRSLNTPSLQTLILTVLIHLSYWKEIVHGEEIRPPNIFHYKYDPLYDTKTNEYRGMICVGQTTRYKPLCPHDGHLRVGVFSPFPLDREPNWEYAVEVVNSRLSFLTVPTQDELKKRGHCIPLNLPMTQIPITVPVDVFWICYCGELTSNMCVHESNFYPKKAKVPSKLINIALSSNGSSSIKKSHTLENVMDHNFQNCFEASAVFNLGIARSLAECSFWCFQLKTEEYCIGIHWSSEGRCEAVFGVNAESPIIYDCQFWLRLG